MDFLKTVEIICVFISLLISSILIVYVYLSGNTISKLNSRIEILKSEIIESHEINNSLKNELKFQSKVNKTLREGLDAIINKKNCHVKDV
jgi:hypothetical protein